MRQATGEDVTDAFPSRPKASSEVIVDCPEGLLRILEPEVHVAVWQRQVEPGVRHFVEQEVAPLIVKRCRSGEADRMDWNVFLADLPRQDGSDAFRADVQFLATLFTRITGESRITVKLECVSGTLCERFHVDYVPLRLICCYAGPGTEWLSDGDSDRSRLAPACGNHSDEESGLLLPGALIRQLPQFAVGLFKGGRWPGHTQGGVIHRSPLVRDPSVRRVLFKVDVG